MAELILGHFYIRLDNVEYGREKFIVGGLENSHNAVDLVASAFYWR